MQLLENDALHAELSRNAARFSHAEYAIEKMAAQWHEAFADVLARPKSVKTSLAEMTSRQLTPADVFVASLGHHGGVFEAHRAAIGSAKQPRAEAQLRCLQALDNWSSPTKSTATQYYHFFPQDPWLQKWSALSLK